MSQFTRLDTDNEIIRHVNFKEHIRLHYPTFKHPLPIDLWPILSHVYHALTGKDANSFQFIENKTFLGSPHKIVSILSFYCIFVLSLQYLLRRYNVKPIRLSFLSQCHNLLLMGISITLHLLLVEQIIPMLYEHGLMWSICSPESFRSKMVFLYYLNYLTKFVTLIDTVLLVLKRKRLIFLHLYHHAFTPILCFTQLRGHTAVQWVPITINLALHILVYWYYYLTSCNVKITWKQWVTRLQIIQFLIILGFVFFSTWSYFRCPSGNRCYGTKEAYIYGNLILTSYMVLFIFFYRRLYKKQAIKIQQRMARMEQKELLNKDT